MLFVCSIKKYVIAFWGIVMGFQEILFIAFGLAMDAFAVAVTSGMLIKRNVFGNGVRIGLAFGFFQGFMPLLGWIIGLQFKDYIVKVDHWIAFALLGFIGIKMIVESIKKDEQDNEINPLDNKVLLMLSIATSIDALIVGLSFAFLDVSITTSALTIGIITFVLSFSGVLLGDKFGQMLKGKAEIFGGLVLVIIGIKILAEHTNFLYVFN